MLYQRWVRKPEARGGCIPFRTGCSILFLKTFTPGGLKSDLTIFSRYNKCLNNALAKEFCAFDHHRLHVFLPVFLCVEVCTCVLGSMPPVTILQGKNDLYVRM